MTFDWLIRHQKKILFVMAVVLMVGWGFGSILMRLLPRKGSGGGPGEVIFRLAGEDVTHGEYLSFRASWTKVFRDLSREGMQQRFGRDVHPVNVMLAYMALHRMAEKCNIYVDDETLVSSRGQVIRQLARRDIKDPEELRKWLAKNLKMSPDYLDMLVRQRIMAEIMLADILGSIEPTDAEAMARYIGENRSVQVRYVPFSIDDYVDGVEAPTADDITKQYEDNKGEGKLYFTPAKVQIEYVKAGIGDFESHVSVTVDEMQKYYEDRKEDLYRAYGKEVKDGEETPKEEGEAPAAEGEPKPATPDEDAKVEYVPFPKVKPGIERTLKRAKATANAVKALNDVRKLYGENPQGVLEAYAKQVNGKLGYEGLKYARTPFLTDVELLETPEIGDARAVGQPLVELAFKADPKAKKIDDVLATPDARFIFRPVDKQEETVPALSDIREQVVRDLRRNRALEKAREDADKFHEAVKKDERPDALKKLAVKQKRPVKDSMFFRNNYYDAARPDFIERSSALKVGDVYGPWTSSLAGEVAVLRVTDERVPDVVGFKAERRLNRSIVGQEKRAAFYRDVFPKAILAFAYEELKKEDQDDADSAEKAPPDTPEPPPP